MSIFFILFHFSMTFLKANRIATDETLLRRLIWVSSVCLCPIKRTPGLHYVNVSVLIKFSHKYNIIEVFLP